MPHTWTLPPHVAPHPRMCAQAFHPLCARNAGLPMVMEEVHSGDRCATGDESDDDSGGGDGAVVAGDGGVGGGGRA
eukprot:161130-Chlamydomonas_euryale.AAC.1